MQRIKHFLTRCKLGLFLALLTLCAAVLGVHAPNFPLQNSVLALLPDTAGTDEPPELAEIYLKRLDRQAVLMIKGTEQAFAYALTKLKADPAAAAVNAEINAEDRAALGRFMFEHRAAFLTEPLRSRLKGEGESAYLLSVLYSAFSGVSAAELNHDPLLIMRQLQESLSSGQRLTLCGDYLCAAAQDTQDPKAGTAEDAGARWYFAHVELKSSGFALGEGEAFAASVGALEQELAARYPGTQLLRRGTVFYNAAAAQSAVHDISFLGTATLSLVVLVIWAAFSSLLPLALVLLSLISAGIIGLAAVLMIFGEVHSFTLLLSLSVIGLCCDYSLYYLSQHAALAPLGKAAPYEALRRAAPALLLAFAAAAPAYLLMLAAPFPGVRQMALLAVCALGGACLFVICCEPYLVRLGRAPQLRAEPWCAAWLKLLRRVLPIIAAAAALLTLWGTTQVKIEDDLARLSALPEDLYAQDRAISELSGQSADQKWLLLWAEDEETLLLRLDAARQSLDELKSAGAVASYTALPLNSLSQQREDAALIAAAFKRQQGLFKELGLDPQFNPAELKPLTLADFLQSPAARLYGLTYAHSGSLHALAVPVAGVTDSAAVSRAFAGREGISFSDRRADFTEMFASYRVYLTWLLAAAAGVMLLFFIKRWGLRRGAKNALPTLLALGTALGTCALYGQGVNLFVILALVMVLGVGINYTLFFANDKSPESTAFCAVTLAMLTTEFTLGVLVFSAVGAVSAFGLTLGSGILTAYLLAPLGRQVKEASAAGTFKQQGEQDGR